MNIGFGHNAVTTNIRFQKNVTYGTKIMPTLTTYKNGTSINNGYSTPWDVSPENWYKYNMFAKPVLRCADSYLYNGNVDLPRAVYMDMNGKALPGQINLIENNRLSNYNVPQLSVKRNSVTRVAGLGNMFRGCVSFNGMVTFPTEAVSAAAPIVLQYNSHYEYSGGITYMFYECANFNQPILPVIPMYANATKAFSKSGFNQSLILSSACQCTEMLSDSNYNSPIITAPNTNMKSMLRNCPYFNHPITVYASGYNNDAGGNNKLYLDSNAEGLLGACHNFNSPVTFQALSNVPAKHTMFSTTGLLLHCDMFNKPIHFPKAQYINLSAFLAYASKFNSEITFTPYYDASINWSNMYYNKDLTWINTTQMFEWATSFNRDLHFPGCLLYSSSMFHGAENFSSNIYLDVRYGSVTNWFEGTSWKPANIIYTNDYHFLNYAYNFRNTGQKEVSGINTGREDDYIVSSEYINYVLSPLTNEPICIRREWASGVIEQIG